jgi:hypothetical protein
LGDKKMPTLVSALCKPRASETPADNIRFRNAVRASGLIRVSSASRNS